jgi:serpin B
VELPRFELKSRYRLNEALQRLGMVRAFQPGGAQLAGMFMPEDGHRAAARFSISSVQQATYLKVDEAGAQAAAVTSIGVRSAAVVRAPPPFHMVIDRPFFCAIEDRRSGALLFIGAIHDPATNANVPR